MAVSFNKQEGTGKPLYQLEAGVVCAYLSPVRSFPLCDALFSWTYAASGANLTELELAFRIGCL
jgi:hypothetical protein